MCSDFSLYFPTYLYMKVGGMVASWLVRSFPEQAVRVRALAGDTLLRSWARHLTLSASLHPGV